MPYIQEMLQHISNLQYFSIADSIKPKYGPYIQQYLTFESVADSDKLVMAKNILVIGDINTSGSTLNEVVRCIRSLNTFANLCIYTLIGKEPTIN